MFRSELVSEPTSFRPTSSGRQRFGADIFPADVLGSALVRGAFEAEHFLRQARLRKAAQSFMSDPVALLCVRGDDPRGPSAQRWRRRAAGDHEVRVAAALAARPVRAAHPLRGMRGALVALMVVGAASSTAVGALLAHSGDAAFSRRIGAGCEELEPCQALEAEAEGRLDACKIACGRAAAELATARQMRFRAEERRVVREHYRERERGERVERERAHDEQRDRWQRERVARAEEVVREQQHRLELERLRQEHIDRRVAEERQRRVGYFTALGAEGRAQRLKRCLEKSDERCDALTLDLLDAATGSEERRALAEANEGIVHPAPKLETPSRAKSEALVGETSSEAHDVHAAPAELAGAISPPSS